MNPLEKFCAQLECEPPASVKIGKRFFFDPNNLSEISENWDVFSIGIFLGEERGEFIPTPGLIKLLSAEKLIGISEKATWMFICGKDVLMQGAKENNLKKGDFVIVTDSDGNHLGYAEVVNEYNAKAKNKLFLKNKMDLGNYLRREK